MKKRWPSRVAALLLIAWGMWCMYKYGNAAQITFKETRILPEAYGASANPDFYQIFAPYLLAHRYRFNLPIQDFPKLKASITARFQCKWIRTTESNYPAQPEGSVDSESCSFKLADEGKIVWLIYKADTQQLYIGCYGS